MTSGTGSPPFLSLSSHGSIVSLRTPEGTPQFVNLPEKYRCPSCHNLLRDAVQLLCGHHICEKCVDNFFGGEEIKLCTFDDCGFQVSKQQIFPDACRRREILDLEVYCKYQNEGCKVKVRWKNLEQHIVDCEYRTVTCKWSSNGCTAMVTAKNKEYHEKQECQYILIQCDHCLEELPKINLEDHLKLMCPAVVIKCPYGCDTEPAARQTMRIHMRTCTMQPQPCSFSCIGCTFQGSEKDVYLHEKNDTSSHIDMVRKFAQDMDSKNTTMFRELQELKAEKELWQRHMFGMEEKYREIKAEVEAFRRSNNELKKLIVSQRERMIVVERKVEDLCPKQQVEALVGEMNTLKERLTQTLTKVTALERAGPQTGTNPQLATQVKNIEKQCSMHDVRLAELDLRFQILETANYDGVLMWKIKDYKRRLQEAKQGRTISLFSQPFYTHKNGYKMCGRVYLNGDGIGKGTHMSYFFVIMRGDYDNLLPWPFRQRVSLMLLDQDTRAENVCDTFEPDPNSNSFRKPVSEMNVASGVPCFIEHTKLDTRKYLQDDTIYLKIKVDCSNMAV